MQQPSELHEFANSPARRVSPQALAKEPGNDVGRSHSWTGGAVTSVLPPDNRTQNLWTSSKGHGSGPGLIIFLWVA